MAQQNKLTSYDKSILFPVKVSNVMFVLYVIINLFCPIYADSSMGYTKIFSYNSIICVLIGVMGVHGYFNQCVPILPLLLVRVFQFLLCNILKKMIDVNVIIFIIFCVIDIGYIAFFFIDRANYEYVCEEDE